MSFSERSKNVVVIRPLDPDDTSTVTRLETAARPYKGAPWTASIGTIKASAQALDAIGTFLIERLKAGIRQ